MWSNRKDAAPAAQASPTPDDDLISWRQMQLLRAGFESELAACVAADRVMDLHALIDLVERGCPPKVAVRILAPLDRQVEWC
jgi:hypothetical protein